MLLLVCGLTEATEGPGGLGVLHMTGFEEQIREVFFVSFTAGVHRSPRTPYRASGLKSPSVAGGKYPDILSLSYAEWHVLKQR